MLAACVLSVVVGFFAVARGGAGSQQTSGSANAVARPVVAPAVPLTSRPGPAGEAIAVSSVTDGDTLDLADGRTIRLAQVDAPERGACFGAQSTAALRALVDGKSVTLRRPAEAPAKDKYGRTLAELFVDGVSVDEALIRDGAAEWYEQFAHEDADLAARLERAETEARARGRGLWTACHGGSPSVPATTAPPTTSPAMRPLVGAPTNGNCHPSYPEDCLPPAPPDLDCPSIGHRVRVDPAYGDPHRLDANADGWGCESYG